MEAFGFLAWIDAMTELRRRMIEDMRLNGLAPSTQKVYLNAVERLATHFGRSPELLSEQDLREYFTHLVAQRLYQFAVSISPDWYRSLST